MVDSAIKHQTVHLRRTAVIKNIVCPLFLHSTEGLKRVCIANLTYVSLLSPNKIFFSPLHIPSMTFFLKLSFLTSLFYFMLLKCVVIFLQCVIKLWLWFIIEISDSWCFSLYIIFKQINIFTFLLVPSPLNLNFMRQNVLINQLPAPALPSVYDWGNLNGCDFVFLLAPFKEVHRSLCKTKNYCSHKVCCK